MFYIPKKNLYKKYFFKQFVFSYKLKVPIILCFKHEIFGIKNLKKIKLDIVNFIGYFVKV